MPIAIIPMTSEDEAKGKAYVHCMAWKEAYRGLIDQAFLDARTLEFSEERALRAFRSGVTTLLAKDGERVVGFADYGPCRDGDLRGAGEVYAIYLLSDYYGQGIGTRLMEAAFQAMAGSDKVVVWVLKGNERAIRFYHSLGFEFDGAAQTLNLGGEATDLRMVLQPDDPAATLHADWQQANIVGDHGPLMELYALMGDGKTVEGELDEEQRGWGSYLEANPNYVKYDFISEGDSPSFFYLPTIGGLPLSVPRDRKG